MTKTRIPWCDFTWSPVTGCSPVSEGCAHCYAERMARRFGCRDCKLTMGGPCSDKKNRDNCGAKFKVRLHPDRLDQPLHWKKPRMIFVCSMGDLFHDDVPDEFIDQVIGIAARCPQHTLLFLTKRAERLRDYSIERTKNAHGITGPFPLPNVWLGVTAENQARADERIPILLQTPAAKRFVSIEPMLGPIDLHRAGGEYIDPLTGARFWEGCNEPVEGTKLDWIIVGGESGPGARECREEWMQSVYDQCQAAGVPFFFKGYGSNFKQNPKGCEVWESRREWPVGQ